jgi:radical SAM protein with 4Fe4S-binding SPASM domain
MEITLDSYPLLRPRTIFQRTPDGARLNLRGVVPDKSKPWKDYFTNSVNMDAARLLELSNGERTLRGIVAEFNKINPASRIDEATALNFFRKAAEQDLAEIAGSARTGDSTFCGEYDYFFPAHVTVELTDKCNYFCKHCYRSSAPSRSTQVSFEALKSFLGDFHRHGGVVVELTGGEPMLHPDFFEIVKWCNERFSLVGVLTNGYYLQEKEVEKLLPYRGHMIFNLSLDSHREDYHDSFRGMKDAYKRTVNAMRLLSENKFFFRVSMSVTGENFFDIEETVKLAKKLGARAFTFNPVFDVGRGQKSAGPLITDPVEAKKYVDYEVGIYEKYSGFLSTLDETQQAALKKSNCGLLSKTITISPDGTIRGCVMFDSVFEIGNINRQDYESIFRRKELVSFSRLPAPREEFCGDCPHLGYCKGCVLRGLKKATDVAECRWLDKTGMRDSLKGLKVLEKKCHNSMEPAV